MLKISCLKDFLFQRFHMLKISYPKDRRFQFSFTLNCFLIETQVPDDLQYLEIVESTKCEISKKIPFSLDSEIEFLQVIYNFQFRADCNLSGVHHSKSSYSKPSYPQFEAQIQSLHIQTFFSITELCSQQTSVQESIHPIQSHQIQPIHLQV